MDGWCKKCLLFLFYYYFECCTVPKDNDDDHSTLLLLCIMSDIPYNELKQIFICNVYHIVII